MRNGSRIPILISVLALLLSACGGETAADPTVPDSTSAHPDDVQAWLDNVRAQHEGEEVVLLMASHPATSAFQATIGAFEEATGISVEFDVAEEGSMIEKQIAECGRSGDTYDLYMIAVEGVTRMAQTECATSLQGAIGDLPSWYDYEDIKPAYRDLMDVNGEMYAIPFAGESVFLMYRTDLFEEHGQTVPQTWDELLEVAKFFSENVDGVDGVSFRARRGWEFTYTYSIFLFPFGGQLVNAADAADCPTAQPAGCDPAIDVQGSIDALEYMIALKEYAPVGVEAFSFPEAWQAMQTGRVAMAVEATAAAPELENPDTSLVAGNVGYTTLPAGPAGAYTGVWGWGLGINNHSTSQDAARAVMTWLTSRYTANEYLNAGGIASRTSDFENPDNQARFPYFAAIADSLEQAATLTATGHAVVPKARIWFQWSDDIGNFGSQAFVGGLDSAEAVSLMQEAMEAAGS
jgi:multiple sugar transport system substrate-binding protein